MDKKIEFFKAQSGCLSARYERNDGTTIHVHSIVRPEEEGTFFADLPVWGDRILFVGTGLGYHLSGIVHRIPQNGKILLLEYHDDLLTKCKEMVFPDGETASLSSGSSDKEQIISSFLRGGTYVQIIKHPVSYALNREFYDSLLSEKLTYPGPKHLKGKMLFLTGNFFVQKELIAAARKIGAEPVSLDYTKNTSPQDYESRLQCLIQKEHPEIIISVNMLGFDGNGILGEISQRQGVPVAVWFVDDPNPILLHQQKYLREQMHAFCWERSYVDCLESSFCTAAYLPLATDPDLFRWVDRRDVVAQLGFVGSSMSGEYLRQLSRKFLWSSNLEPFIQRCAKKLINERSRDILEIIDEVCTECNCRLPFDDRRNRIWLRSYIIHTASMMIRKEIVSELIPLGIETFGDREGWQTLCGPELRTNPDIDYHHDLPCTYRSIGTSVNLTSCQMPTAVNQRVFDIPACGGFVISDEQKDLQELFGKDEIVTFSDFDDLKEKVVFYKTRESERMRISRNARERIVKEHTYAHRITTMLHYLHQSI